MIAMIDEFTNDSNKVYQEKLSFPEWFKVDTQRIAVAGHSFGGITAAGVTYLDKRVKACLTFDPWYFIYEKDILQGKFKLNVPLIMVNSEHFGDGYKFECWRCIKEIGKNSTSMHNESFIMKDFYHA